MDKEIAILGCGMGSRESMSTEAVGALDAAEIYIGAKRLLDALAVEGAESRAAARTEDVISFLRDTNKRRIAILVSGDSGFYSAAGRYAAAIEEAFGSSASVRIYPGISSLSYLSARSGISWEDADIYSLHGRGQCIYATLAAGGKAAILGGEGFEELLKDMLALGYGESRAVYGERLGTKEESILKGTVYSLQGRVGDPLSVLLIEAKGPRLRTAGIEDDSFIRGSVPMTKSEVRSVIASRLCIGKHDVLYDIGAGSGSVSVECAIAAACGSVYAIEKEKAACELIRQNMKKFLCRNIELVEGTAPEAFKDLPVPDAAFIGGSAGMLNEIVQALLEKNKKLRIVMSAVSLESVGTALAIFKSPRFMEPEIIGCSISRALLRAGRHMMSANNPVWIISATGSGEA